DTWSQLLARIQPEPSFELLRLSINQAAQTAPPGTSFGDVLSRALAQQRGDLAPLVVDAAALRDQGFDPWLPLPAGQPTGDFWTRAGLALVSYPDASLLTTQCRAQAWHGVPPTDVAAAVAEARASSRDRSGRYELAVDWLDDRRDCGA